jgi:two-component system, response regulator PdtaR
MTLSPRVLIVEDERMIAEYFKVIIEHLGYSVIGIAMTADEAIRLARDEDPAMVFMDVRLAGTKDGVDAANEIHQINPVPTVYITGSQEPSTMDRILTNHPSDVLIKPVLEAQLREALSRFCPIQ